MFRFTIRDVLWLTVVVGLAVWARGDDAPFDYRSVIKVTTATLEREHYSRRKLDDKLSAEWLMEFIEQLDPQRMYFLQADIEDFKPFEHLLDDHAKTGDFQFPELVRKRYRERVSTATKHAISLVVATHDYSVDESRPLRYEAYPKSADELRERWRLRIKSELLIETVHGRPLEEVQTHLRQRYQRIDKQAQEMSEERLCQFYLDALAACYDSQSAFYSPTYNTMFDGGFFRVYRLGLVLRYNLGRYFISGFDPQLTNSDAISLGGWELMGIKRKNGEIVDFVEMHPEDAASAIRYSSGPLKSDTEVVLELLNPTTLRRMSLKWNRLAYR